MRPRNPTYALNISETEWFEEDRVQQGIRMELGLESSCSNARSGHAEELRHQEGLHSGDPAEQGHEVLDEELD